MIDKDAIFSVADTLTAEDFYKLSVQLSTNSSFSGALATPADKAFSSYATDPICGPNRAYVK